LAVVLKPTKVKRKPFSAVGNMFNGNYGSCIPS
jgi:hypothetical protein